MAIAYMRNRRTTEHRAVELDSEEFYELRAEVGPDSRPTWEQTSQPNAVEQQKRIEEGHPRDEDIGDDDQPVAKITGDAPLVTPPDDTGGNDVPTPGEQAMLDEHGAPDGYEGQTVPELKDELSSRELPVSGSKNELVARLEGDDQDRQDDDEEEEG